MNKTVTSFLLFSISFHLAAQYNYEEAAKNISVEINGQLIDAPFTGGYNTAQFSELDLNQDGILDLLVYDRAKGQIRPYLNAGIPNTVSYSYAPEYAKFFPAIQDWLKTADYNNDGKMDLIEGRSNIVVWENTSTSSTGLSFELTSKLKSLYSPQSPSTITINPSIGSLPGFYDIDKDSDLDLFLFNSNAKSMDYHRNLSQENAGNFDFDYERRNTCWGNFIESGINSNIYLDSCVGPIPPSGELSKIDYFGNVHYQIEKNKGLKHAGSTVNPIDIDNNGSMDLLIADVDGYQLKLLINEDTSGTNSHVISFQDSFPNYDKPVDLLFPAAYFIDLNNDGFKDMIVSPNVANFSSNFPLGLDDIYYYQNTATDGSFRFNFQEKRFLIDQTLDFGLGCHPIFFDYNKDGLQDLLIGNDGYIDSNLTDIKGQLALFENIGNSEVPKFKLIDRNYLTIPSLKLDVARDTNSRSIIPTAGDIDGDGDDDLLIGEAFGNIFLFEDTAISGMPAAFKFHPEPYQGLNIRNRDESNAPVLYDINNDSILDCIVSSSGSSVNYFLNFGTANKPMFNIKVDSIIWQQGSTFRYYFRERPNFNLLEIDDTLAVHNALDLSNNSFIKLALTAINENQNYIECKNITIPSADASFNELNSTAYMTYFNRDWGNLKSSINFISKPRIFPYRENGKTQLIVADLNGSYYFFNEIPDTLGRNDTFNLAVSDYLKDYGQNAFIAGTDLNGDDKVDLAIGNYAGGLKLLFATSGVGISEFKDSPKSTESFFSLYPNPAKAHVSILIDEKMSSETTLYLRDASGKLLLKKVLNYQSELLNTANLPSGLYFISLQNKERYSTKKLIIRP